MKIIAQIIILILVASCVQTKLKNKEGKDKTIEELVTDSTYAKYWCSIEVLKKIEKSLDELEITMLEEFLASFHENCKNNIEYSEWSNELLFKVIEKSPDNFLQLLFKNSSLDKGVILNELSSPINDNFEIDNLVEIIKKANAPEEIKTEIIESLNSTKQK